MKSFVGQQTDLEQYLKFTGNQWTERNSENGCDFVTTGGQTILNTLKSGEVCVHDTTKKWIAVIKTTRHEAVYVSNWKKALNRKKQWDSLRMRNPTYDCCYWEHTSSSLGPAHLLVEWLEVVHKRGHVTRAEGGATWQSFSGCLHSVNQLKYFACSVAGFFRL